MQLYCDILWIWFEEIILYAPYKIILFNTYLFVFFFNLVKSNHIYSTFYMTCRLNAPNET